MKQVFFAMAALAFSLALAPTYIQAQLPYSEDSYYPSLPAPLEFIEKVDIKDVFFDTASARINEDMRTVIDENVSWFKNNPTFLILLEGHTDERGFHDSNLELGERRAKAVREYMIAAGVEGWRITIISYGDFRPFALGHDKKSRSLNRRVHFLFKPDR